MCVSETATIADERPNTIFGKNISPFGYRNLKEIDESDYLVVKELYENHLSLVDAKDSGYPVVAQMFLIVRIREQDTNRRICRLILPEISSTFLPTSIIRLDALETLNLGKWTKKLPRWIGKLKSLKMLRIAVYEQHLLPEEIGDLTNLEQLQVIGQSRAQFPASMKKLKNLKMMRISIEHLPTDIENLKHLEALHIGPNIRSLPPSIGNLKNLKKLDLYAARLRFLPDEIGNLTSLEVLNLEYSFLRSLPHSIGNLKSLKYLNLSRMHARIVLPDEIGNLRNLNDLDFSDTITTASMIPLTITNLKNLRNLHLSRAFHSDTSNQWILLKLAEECPKLGCLGYETGHGSEEDSSRIDLAIRLMRNRINTRLFCKTSTAQNDSLTKTRLPCHDDCSCDDEEILFKPALWPLILYKSRSVIGRYKQCHRRPHCWGCGKQFRQEDAIFQLLVNYGGTVLENRVKVGQR